MDERRRDQASRRGRRGIYRFELHPVHPGCPRGLAGHKRRQADLRGEPGQPGGRGRRRTVPVSPGGHMRCGSGRGDCDGGGARRDRELRGGRRTSTGASTTRPSSCGSQTSWARRFCGSSEKARGRPFPPDFHRRGVRIPGVHRAGSRRNPRCAPIPPTLRAKPPRTCLSGPISKRTGCRGSSPAARTITDRTSSRRRSSRSS